VLSVAEVANKPVAVKAVAIAVDNSFFMLHSNVFNVSIKMWLLESCGADIKALTMPL